MRRPFSLGFTIVELLIVIVIIGILASISIVAYKGIQQRAHDSAVLSGANQISKAYQTSMILTGREVSNGGYNSSYTAATNTCSGGYGGWLDHRNYSYNPNFCTVGRVLENDNSLSKTFFASAPHTNKVETDYSTGSKTYMWMECGSGSGVYALLYSLNTPMQDEITDLSAQCNDGSPWAPFTTYGMNAGRLMQAK